MSAEAHRSLTNGRGAHKRVSGFRESGAQVFAASADLRSRLLLTGQVLIVGLKSRVYLPQEPRKKRRTQLDSSQQSIPVRHTEVNSGQSHKLEARQLASDLELQLILMRYRVGKYMPVVKATLGSWVLATSWKGMRRTQKSRLRGVRPLVLLRVSRYLSNQVFIDLLR